MCDCCESCIAQPSLPAERVALRVAHCNAITPLTLCTLGWLSGGIWFLVLLFGHVLPGTDAQGREWTDDMTGWFLMVPLMLAISTSADMLGAASCCVCGNDGPKLKLVPCLTISISQAARLALFSAAMSLIAAVMCLTVGIFRLNRNVWHEFGCDPDRGVGIPRRHLEHEHDLCEYVPDGGWLLVLVGWNVVKVAFLLLYARKSTLAAHAAARARAEARDRPPVEGQHIAQGVELGVAQGVVIPTQADGLELMRERAGLSGPPPVSQLTPAGVVVGVPVPPV